jgi:hypothetical protein
MPDPDRRPTRIDETDAKAGSNEGVVRWVLLVSLGLAIIALTIIWVTGALTQGPVESQMNVERKVDAQRDQADDNDDLAEEADLVSPDTPQEAISPAPEVTN